MKYATRRAASFGAALALAGGLGLVAPAKASEYGFSDYLLGYSIPMSGYTPPPGLYYTNTFYFYNGSASKNLQFPLGNSVGAGLNFQFAFDISQISWVTDVKILGGSLGFAALVPFGSETTFAGIDFTGPHGINRQLGVERETTALGDSAFAAFIGWENGEHHWNVTLTGFAPTGHYDPNQISFTSLNRPAIDVKGAYTYLSPQTGFEFSAAAGLLFNAVNAATNYQSGEEFHLQWALVEHLPFGLAAGVGGYFLQQFTNDGGLGDEHLGPFRERVASVGPVVSYTIKAGEQQVLLSGSWYREFAVQNRVTGDAAFASLSFRF